MKSFAKILGVGAIASILVVTAQEKPGIESPSSSATVATGATNGPAGRLTPRIDRSRFDLSPEQRTKVDEINRSFGTNATPISARLASARRELESLVNQDKTDETAIRAKTKEISDLEADLAIARSRRYAQLRGFLTAEQARRYNAPMPVRPFQPQLHSSQAPPLSAPEK